MPNHTINDVDIKVNTGEEKELLALAELKTKLNIGENEFDFNSIIPQPSDWNSVEVYPTFPDISGTERVEPSESWYDWRLQNWGTKWNSYEFELYDESKSDLQVRFLTAWSPPHEIFIALRNYCNEHNLVLGWEYMQEEDGYEETYQLDQEC
tara:strand:- start:46 stop:501 length:456 start_codon:yes stop_codon:yes gene_type:complete